MRVISNKALVDFAEDNEQAAKPLQAWRKVIETNDFANFAALKTLMNATDRVGDFYVFDISGNKYRVVAAIHFDKQRLYVRHVFTHQEYDQWSAKR